MVGGGDPFYIKQPGKDGALSQLKSARFISQITPEIQTKQ